MAYFGNHWLYRSVTSTQTTRCHLPEVLYFGNDNLSSQLFMDMASCWIWWWGVEGMCERTGTCDENISLGNTQTSDSFCVYTILTKKIPKSIRSIEKSHLYKCNRQACVIVTGYKVQFLTRRSATLTYIFWNPSRLHQRPRNSSVFWLGYSVCLISDGTNFFSKISPSPPGHPFSYTMRIGDPFLPVIEEWPWIFSSMKGCILKKGWRFPTTRKLPLEEEVFSIKMSRSSARKVNPLAQAQYILEPCVLGKDKRDTGLGSFSRKYSSLISFLVGGWVDCLVVCLVAFFGWLVSWLFVFWLVGGPVGRSFGRVVYWINNHGYLTRDYPQSLDWGGENNCLS